MKCNWCDGLAITVLLDISLMMGVVQHVTKWVGRCVMMKRSWCGLAVDGYIRSKKV